MSKNLNSNYNYAIGLDIGGSKVIVAGIEPGGAITWSKKEAVNPKSSKTVIKQMVGLAREGLSRLGLAGCLGVGIALPAVIAPDNDTIIQAPNLPVLEQVKLKSALSKELGQDHDRGRPIILGFDGMASVIAEAWLGAGNNHANLATVAIGTGIGGGLMLDGRVVKGHNNVAGAIGWSRLGIDQQTRSFENICAGPAIAAQGKKFFPGRDYLAEKIFDAAEEGDETALELINYIISHVGVNMGNLVSLLNPEMIVFTGSVGLRLKPYLEQIRQLIITVAQPIAARSVSLACSNLGNNAVVLGAAGLILKQEVISGKTKYC